MATVVPNDKREILMRKN